LPKTLAEIAIDAGLVNRAEAARAGRAAEQRAVPLVVALVRELEVDELALMAAIRKQIRVPGLDPAAVRPEAEALRAVPKEVCRRHRVLPVQLATDRGVKVLRVAMADPTDAAAIAEVEHVAGCELEISVLPLSAIEELAEQGFRNLAAAPPRGRRPFGEALHVATQPHLRRDQVGDDTAVTPATTPFHSVADEADHGLRLRALVRLLEAKGVLGDGELEQAVIDLMRAGRDEEPVE
jgi:hypothetical protein